MAAGAGVGGRLFGQSGGGAELDVPGIRRMIDADLAAFLEGKAGASTADGP
ncbi:hypothetical protein ACIQCG_41160 [Streptomyces noursei]|uniref:hypothetical protein n=1 Tax=Streptomyces noursei TaxID=1971 RepID=UPI0037FD00F6